MQIRESLFDSFSICDFFTYEDLFGIDMASIFAVKF